MLRNLLTQTTPVDLFVYCCTTKPRQSHHLRVTYYVQITNNMSDVKDIPPFRPKECDLSLPGCITPDVCAPSWHRYRQRWRLPDHIAVAIRQKYSNDREAYYADYSITQCAFCRASREKRTSRHNARLLKLRLKVPKPQRNRDLVSPCHIIYLTCC